MKTNTLAAVALGAASLVVAESSLAKTCPQTNLCYSLNIPQSTVQSNGQGDIYFQISAPTSYSWAALGQGSEMAGANMFIIYTSGNGQNVTLSPRLGTGNVEPQHDTDAQVELLEGSGVSNGMMIANIKCSNCNQWNGGSMDFTAQSAKWIYAAKNGNAIDSDDVSADISQHNKYSAFQWQLGPAQGGQDVNPFVAAAVATGGSSQTASATGSAATASMDTGSSSGAATYSQSTGPFGGNSELGDRIITAHGTLSSIAFVLLFPLGAILIRLASFSGVVWVHAAIQVFGYLIVIAGFGLGLYAAIQQNETGDYHPIIGMVLFVIVFSQLFTGLLHHKMFKSRGVRNLFSFLHLGIGRILIILGLINGGLGLALADASSSAKIAYAVCAAVMGAIYIASAIFGEVKRSKDIAREAESPFSEDKGHRQLGSSG